MWSRERWAERQRTQFKSRAFIVGYPTAQFEHIKSCARAALRNA